MCVYIYYSYVYYIFSYVCSYTIRIIYITIATYVRFHLYIHAEASRTKSCFKKASFDQDADPDETRKKWESILILDFISSDKSDYEDGKEILINHQIAWLSAEVNNFKQVLDCKIMKTKSQQALRQMKDRREGSPSKRKKPAESHKHPPWIFNRYQN